MRCSVLSGSLHHSSRSFLSSCTLNIQQEVGNSPVKPVDLSFLRSLKKSPARIVPEIVHLPDRLKCGVAYLLDSCEIETLELLEKVKVFNQQWPFRRLYPTKIQTKEILDKYGKIHGSSELDVRNAVTEMMMNNIQFSGAYKSWDRLESLVYCLARVEKDFASMYKVLNELKLKDPEFVPKTCFDFKSRSGFNTWALFEVFPKSLKHIVLAEKSSFQQAIARKLFSGSRKEAFNCIENKLSYPGLSKGKFDLVLGSHNLSAGI
ncbi:MAG: Methyltransferase-like protein 17, mitochondrial [Paramarteilia canceri]